MIWVIVASGIIALFAVYGIWLYFFIHGRKQVLSDRRYDVEIRTLVITCGEKKIWGELLIPKIKGKIPVVICSHGFGASYRGTKTLVGNTLAQSGIACYCFDFYGGNKKSKSGGKMLEMSPLTEKEELAKVLEEISKLNFVDESNIFLFGESQGGLVSALVANESKSNIKGLILYYPAFAIPESAQRICKNGVPQTHKIFGKTVSDKYYKDSMKIDIYNDIKDFDKPVLIVHGNADKCIDVSYGKRASEIYPNAQFVEMDREYHGFSGKGKMKAVRHTYEFIEKQI